MRMLVFVAIATLSMTPAAAADEPLLDALERRLKNEWMSVGLLLQLVADVQSDRDLPGENGFSVANTRVSAKGTLDGHVSYFVQANFAPTAALLDASIGLALSEHATLQAGAMKAPFSVEFLTAASAIDFVNRSQVVSLLAPGRQIGATLRGTLDDATVHYAAGVFNGNGVGPNGNDGDGVLGVARLGVDASDSDGRAQFGVNVAYGSDDDTRVGLDPDFRGDRTVLGADARIERGRHVLSGEILWASLDSRDVPSTEPWGYQITAGTMLGGETQLLARLDAVKADGHAWRNVAIAGLNVWPTRATELQVNVLVPTNESARHTQLLVNGQVAF